MHSPRIVLTLVLALALVAPGSARTQESEPSESEFMYEPVEGELPSDPFEPLNRLTLWTNLALGRALIGPATRASGFVFPGAAGRGLKRAFSNLGLPVVLVNHMLQLRGRDAAETAGRFVVNTTVGILGFRDPATGMGLELEHTDFGQTLAAYWVPSGPYLVLLLIGPTTARDGVGSLTDLLMRPETLVLGMGGAVAVASTDAAGQHGENAELLASLEESSVDLYVSLRTAYLLNRRAQIERDTAEAGADSISAGVDLRELVDPRLDCLDQRGIAAALDDRGILGATQCELAHGPVQEHVDDAPLALDGAQAVVELDLAAIGLHDPAAHESKSLGRIFLVDDSEALAGVAVEAARVVRGAHAPEQIDEAVALR